jgi:hypothetical protein
MFRFRRRETDLVQKEVFGPVATFEVFDTETDAIARANATEYGLAAGLFTSSINISRRVSREIQAAPSGPTRGRRSTTASPRAATSKAASAACAALSPSPSSRKPRPSSTPSRRSGANPPQPGGQIRGDVVGVEQHRAVGFLPGGRGQRPGRQRAERLDQPGPRVPWSCESPGSGDNPAMTFHLLDDDPWNGSAGSPGCRTSRGRGHDASCRS